MINNYLWDLKDPAPFSIHLDSLEKKMIFFPDQLSYQQEVSFGNFLEKEINENNQSKDYAVIVTALKALSLQYRIKATFGGLSPLKQENYDTIVAVRLTTALKSWKESIPQFINKEMTPRDEEKIIFLSRYPRFTQLLLKNEKVKDEFFKLVFRDNFPIKTLIQYFKICSVDLKNALLTMRVGFFSRYERQVLKIQKTNLQNGSREKDLQFLINKKFVSILDDEAEIEMNGGVFTNWKQIKDVWEKNKKFPALMEVFETDGLLCYKPQALKYPVDGYVNSVNTTAPKFWEGENLPTFLTVSKERLEEMLQIEITDDKPCVATVESSCLDPFHVDNSHGASTIYLPNDDGTKYRVFPFGKYAKNFPQTTFEKLSFLGNTVEAEVTYPDPTPFYSQRLHGVSPHLVTLEEAENLLTIYGKDIWYFQFAGNNCSADFQKFFEKAFGKIDEGGMTPNYFRYSVLKAKTDFPLNYIFPPMNRLPPYVSSWLVHGVHLMFGSFRDLSCEEQDGTITIQNLYNSDFCKTQELYVPGLLVHRVLTGEIKGVTWFGYD